MHCSTVKLVRTGRWPAVVIVDADLGVPRGIHNVRRYVLEWYSQSQTEVD